MHTEYDIHKDIEIIHRSIVRQDICLRVSLGRMGKGVGLVEYYVVWEMSF